MFDSCVLTKKKLNLYFFKQVMMNKRGFMKMLSKTTDSMKMFNAFSLIAIKFI